MSEAQEDGVKHLEARRKANRERISLWEKKVRDEAIAMQVNPNKSRKKQNLISLLNEYYPGYQPVVEMCHKAQRLSEIADRRPNDSIAQMDAVNAHEKVAKYVTPQLKAMDITSGGEQITFGFQLILARIGGG